MHRILAAHNISVWCIASQCKLIQPPVCFCVLPDPEQENLPDSRLSYLPHTPRIAQDWSKGLCRWWHPRSCQGCWVCGCGCWWSLRLWRHAGWLGNCVACACLHYQKQVFKQCVHKHAWCVQAQPQESCSSKNINECIWSACFKRHSCFNAPTPSPPCVSIKRMHSITSYICLA